MYGTYDPIHILSYWNVDDLTTDFSTALVLETAAGDTAYVWTIMYPAIVVDFGIRVTVAFDYNGLVTTGVVALDKRITPGSDTGRVEIGRLSLPDGLAIGDVRTAPRAALGATARRLLPGDQLVFERVTTAVGGTELGDYYPWVAIAPYDEHPGNCPNWTVDTTTTQVAT